MEPAEQHSELIHLLHECPGLGSGWAIERSRPVVDRLVTVLRKMMTCAVMFQSGQSPFFTSRALRHLPSPMHKLARSPWAPRMLPHSIILSVLRAASRHFPADADLVRHIRLLGPHVLVASPTNVGGSCEFKYVVAARQVHIPTVIPILSWDTLTTKEALPVTPDVVLAWNKAQLHEAAAFHHIPLPRIEVCGAFKFDYCFRFRTALSARNVLCRRVQIPTSARYMAYVGSSPALCLEEVPNVAQLARLLRHDPDPVIRDMLVIFRPHPQTREDLRQLASLPNVRICCSPSQKELVPIPAREDLRHFYDLLFHSEAVLGVNTSAFWEAIILGKPCIAIERAEYRPVQGQVLHFQQLARSGAVTVLGFSDSLRELRRLVLGYDTRRLNRHWFIKEFIRPRGVGVEPSAVAADIIVQTGRRALPWRPRPDWRIPSQENRSEANLNEAA